MQSMIGKVAVVTGAASGIGFAMAKRFADEHMKVVLSDVEDEALQSATETLRASGADVLAVHADVSKLHQVQALAEEATSKFGKVHVLCNNAGVAQGGLLLDATIRDWEWVLGVNLWGVIYGVHTFLPIMLEHGEESHIVNTASLAGLVCGPGMGIYSLTKHAVVSLSETLFHETKLLNSNVGVSVLCPAWVKTGIAESQRNRPSELANQNLILSPLAQTMQELTRQIIADGLSPDTVADHVVGAIRNKTFYILTHQEMSGAIRMRMEAILNGSEPSFVPPPGFDRAATEITG